MRTSRQKKRSMSSVVRSSCLHWWLFEEDSIHGQYLYQNLSMSSCSIDSFPPKIRTFLTSICSPLTKTQLETCPEMRLRWDNTAKLVQEWLKFSRTFWPRGTLLHTNTTSNNQTKMSKIMKNKQKRMQNKWMKSKSTSSFKSITSIFILRLTLMVWKENQQGRKIHAWSEPLYKLALMVGGLTTLRNLKVHWSSRSICRIVAVSKNGSVRRDWQELKQLSLVSSDSISKNLSLLMLNSRPLVICKNTYLLSMKSVTLF